MKRQILGSVAALAALAGGWTIHAAEATGPMVSEEVAFDEVDGIVAVEAEHFYRQELAEKRAWYIVSSARVPEIRPDADPAHLVDASGGAYVEILPDTRASHGHPLVPGENFSGDPGALALAFYKVNINAPGRYYVWIRSHSTGSEDNGVHVGIDGQWPESGQRWQTTQKRRWAWDCRQRTEQQHAGVPMQLFLDIDAAGEHDIVFSLREDGFEMDKFVLARDIDYRPEGKGPAPKAQTGTLPEAFAGITEQTTATKPFPGHWGTPPKSGDGAPVELPGAMGCGSAALATWVQAQLDRDAASDAGSLYLEASSFPIEGTDYYLDKGKWLAINPGKNQTATAELPFPYPSGLYDVKLLAVGEEDGESTFTVYVAGRKVGEFRCPLSSEAMEEGPSYQMVWAGQAINSGDPIAVGAAVASSGGLEFSRARWSRLVFAPANEATRAEVAKVVAARAGAETGTQTSAAPAMPRGPDAKKVVESAATKEESP